VHLADLTRGDGLGLELIVPEAFRPLAEMTVFAPA
jgi:hypothetical protein